MVLGLAVIPNKYPSDTAGRGRALTPAKIERPDEALRAQVAVRLPPSLSLHPLGWFCLLS